MGKIIIVGQKDTAVVKNRSFQSIAFDFVHEAAAAATAFTTTVAPVNLEEINVEIKLKQFGNSYTLYSGNMYSAVMKSLFGTPAYFQFKAGSSTAQKYGIILAQDTGVKEKIVQKAVINFGTFINLKGRDSLEIYVDYKSASATAQVGAASYMEVDVEDGIGVQSKIPYIHSKQITGGVERVNESLPSNLTSLHILNTDKDDVLEASRPVDRVQLNSDKLNFTKEWSQLIGNRLEIEQTNGIQDELDHDHELVNTTVGLNSVKLLLNTVAANVSTGKNYIVTTTYKTSRGLVGRALSMERKHNSRNSARIK